MMKNYSIKFTIDKYDIIFAVVVILAFIIL